MPLKRFTRNSLMEIITVFQDYKTSLKGYEEHFDNILSFKEILGSQNCILEVNGDIRISKYIGTLVRGNTCLQVVPKIYATGVNVPKIDEFKKSLDFVYRLLYWSGFLGFKSIENSFVSENDNNLIEIIIRIFIDQFLKLHKRNIYREYVSHEEDMLFVKGKILFNQSIMKQVQKSGNLVVLYDDLSINNIINRIIKTTIQKLLFITSNSENKKLLRLGLGYLDEVELISLHMELFDRIIFNRMNKEYEPLINLAKILFYKKQPGISAGKSQTISFVVPLNLLFENFFLTVLKSVYSNSHKVLFQKGQYLAKDISGTNRFQIKPDFVIINGNNTETILDTKFKNPYDKDGNISISSSDIYQMCTYALSFQCQKIYLVYPLFVGQQRKKVLEQYIIKRDNIEILLTIIQIDITKENLKEIISETRKSLEVSEHMYILK